MKTRAMDKAKTAVNDCLYPFKTLLVEQGYPSTEHFEVKQDAEGFRPGSRRALPLRVACALPRFPVMP